MDILLVSHSKQLAEATKEFCEKMFPKNTSASIHIVAGDDQNNLGNSFNKIKQAIDNIYSLDNQIIIICDIGSAVMTTKLVLSSGKYSNDNIRIANAAFLEGTIASYAAISEKSRLDEIIKICEYKVDKGI